MREIKFRAWDGMRMTLSGVYFDNSRGTVETAAEMPLMQYTGLKDKNGVEIYEGDIMEFDVAEWGGDDNIHVVSWNERDAEWCWGGGNTGDMEWRKVIGNIHENPELL